MKKPKLKKLFAVTLCFFALMSALAVPAFAYSPPSADVSEDIADGRVFYQASEIALYETVDDMSDIDNRPIFNVVYLGATYVYADTNDGDYYLFEETYLSFGAQNYYETNSNGTITTARYLEVTDDNGRTLMWYNPATDLFTFIYDRSTASVVYFSYNPEDAYVSLPDLSVYFGFVDYSFLYDYGFEDGYTDGREDGYAQGDEEGYEIGYDEGYRLGFSAGQLSNYDGFTIKDLMNAVVSAPVNMVRSMLNVEVLGYNLSGIFFGLITLSILVTVVVIIFKVAR